MSLGGTASSSDRENLDLDLVVPSALFLILDFLKSEVRFFSLLLTLLCSRLLISLQGSLNFHFFCGWGKVEAGAGWFGIRLDFPADSHRVNGNRAMVSPEGHQTPFLVYLKQTNLSCLVPLLVSRQSYFPVLISESCSKSLDLFSFCFMVLIFFIN